VGFQEYFLLRPGYDDSRNKGCTRDVGGGTYACLKGTCGDGVCEDAESAACGCADDCPAAAWTGTDAEVPPSQANGFTEPPASCDKRDILARMEPSPGSIGCGDLLYEASDTENAVAVRCVEAAYDASKPFHVFWQVLVDDRAAWRGLVARLEAGRLQVFNLEIYDADAQSIGLAGASATWTRTELQINANCGSSFETCVHAGYFDRTHCYCLPQGKRPAAPDGEKVELRCQSQ
jgi:hypothetical protein